VSDAIWITDIAAGGDGVGRMADGRAIFIPRTAPGDLVEPQAVRLHSSYAKGRLGVLREAAAVRVTPRCGHYDADACGGCQIQHLSAPAQREAKRRILEQALLRIGGVQVEIPTVESGPEWGYRNRITLTLDTTGTLGFHQVGRPDELFDVSHCEIARPVVNDLLATTRKARETIPRGTTRITLREGRQGQPGIVLWGEAPPSRAESDIFRAALEDATPDAPPDLWWHGPNGDSRPISAGEDGVGVVGFEQVQPDFGDRIRTVALDLLRDVDNRLVWDLYAGAGEGTAILATKGARVESVERNPALFSLAQRNAFPGVRRLLGTVEESLSQLSPPERVVVNPPRTGLGAVVTEALGEAGPERIAYVSCDPATLARDIKRLAPLYDLETVRAFDLFPQTAHVESVALLVRR